MHFVIIIQYKSFRYLSLYFVYLQGKTTQLYFLGISTAGSLLLVQELAVNLHIVFLLLALSRSSNPGEGWYAPVRPVIYSPQHREEQLHLWDLSAHPGPLDKLVRQICNLLCLWIVLYKIKCFKINTIPSPSHNLNDYFWVIRFCFLFITNFINLSQIKYFSPSIEWIGFFKLG